MKKYVKTFEINPDEVEIHELADLTPEMTEAQFEALKQSIEEFGQLEPAKFYRGKLVDGRHRLKAIKEIGIGHISHVNIDSQTTLEEVGEIVERGFEERRHQSPTQRAIMAYRYWARKKEAGDKLSQGEVAKMFGVGRAQVAGIKKLMSVGSDMIVEALFQGKEIETLGGRTTSNIRAVLVDTELRNRGIIKDDTSSVKHKELTYDEQEYVSHVVGEIMTNYGENVAKAIANGLYASIKRIK